MMSATAMYTTSGMPRSSPKLNGSVERAQRTHTDEFYQVTPCSLEMKKLNCELRHWEKIYNTVRPHQSPRAVLPFNPRRPAL
jgi:putative transposase